jgi:hypothetical protein
MRNEKPDVEDKRCCLVNGCRPMTSWHDSGRGTSRQDEMASPTRSPPNGRPMQAAAVLEPDTANTSFDPTSASHPPVQVIQPSATDCLQLLSSTHRSLRIISECVLVVTDRSEIRILATSPGFGRLDASLAPYQRAASANKQVLIARADPRHFPHISTSFIQILAADNAFLRVDRHGWPPHPASWRMPSSHRPSTPHHRHLCRNGSTLAVRQTAAVSRQHFPMRAVQRHLLRERADLCAGC